MLLRSNSKLSYFVCKFLIGIIYIEDYLPTLPFAKDFRLTVGELFNWLTL